MDKLISRRQLLAAAFLGLLSPMTRLLPNLPVSAAGSMAVLAPLAALPVCLLYLRLTAGLMADCPDRQGLHEVLCDVWGRRVGTALSLTAAVWLTLYCGFTLRSGAERLLSAVYTTGRPWFFALIGAIISVLAARGSITAYGRWACVCLIVVLPVLVPLLAAALCGVKAEYVLPITLDGLPSVLPAAVPIINIVSYYGYFPFLYGQVRRQPDDEGYTRRFGLAVTGVMTALILATVGGLSAQICERTQNTFFILVRNLTLFGRAQRIEALVLGIWIITDCIFQAGQLMIASGIFCDAVGGMSRENWCVVLGGAAYAVSLAAQSAFSLLPVSRNLVPASNMIITLGILPLTCLVRKIKKNRAGRSAAR